VYASTPDFKGAFQDGWAATVTRLVETLVEAPNGPPRRGQVNLLPGCHLTPGDIEELREIIEAFGLVPVILPDLSDSLDGHIPDDFTPTTLGGTTLADIAGMGRSELTLAIGEQMRPAAAALGARTGVPYVLFERLTGLVANDAFLMRLAELSGRPVPAKYRRQRSQLEDAMLDGHSFSAAARWRWGRSRTCCSRSARS
jgi:Nitrogenase molybdenum-iron protein, alpha and beta chains